MSTHTALRIPPKQLAPTSHSTITLAQAAKLINAVYADDLRAQLLGHLIGLGTTNPAVAAHIREFAAAHNITLE